MTATGARVGTPVQYQEQQRQAPSDHKAPANYAMQRELAKYVGLHTSVDGYISDSAVLAVGNGALSSGYSLPSGVEIHAVEAWHMMSIAREAGLTQANVTAVFEVMKRRQRR